MQTIEYLAVPFKPSGRTREGVDCWGLVCLIYDEKRGIKLPHYDHVVWDDGPAVAASVNEQAATHWVEVPAEDRGEFDVVVIRVKGLPWHVGVLLNKTTFIHAHPTSGVRIERLDAIHWKSRIVSYHRLK